jgi:hypothetical protein
MLDFRYLNLYPEVRTVWSLKMDLKTRKIVEYTFQACVLLRVLVTIDGVSFGVDH